MLSIFDTSEVVFAIDTDEFARANGIKGSILWHRVGREYPYPDVHRRNGDSLWRLSTAAPYISIGGSMQLINTDPRNLKVRPTNQMVKDFLPCSDPRILAVLERVEMLRLVNECMIGRATSLRGMKLRQLIAEDLFPAPDVRVGSKRWCWNLDTLLAWMRDQELARRSNDRCRWLHDAAGGTANSLHN